MKNIKKDSARLLGMMLITLVFSSSAFTAVVKNIPNKDYREYIDFDTRLQFYIDMKTKRFLKKMSKKELFLLQMVENIVDEMKLRGKERLLKDDIGFNELYVESNKLIEEYSGEIENIIYIIHEVEKLEALVKRGDDLKLLTEVDELRDNLATILEDRKVIKTRMTRKKKSEMIHEYSNEVESLLEIYDEIDKFEKWAQVAGDHGVLKKIKRQKQKILNVLEMNRMVNPLQDSAVEEYMSETTNMVNILRELDRLEVKAVYDSIIQSEDIETVRQNIITSVDNRILDLFGYSENTNTRERLKITDYFREWKAKRIAEYQLKFTEYRLLRTQLIKSASSAEMDRMLERELNDALLNFTDNKNDLAVMQFEEILKTYKPHYSTLDGVYFYKSEANFDNGYFDAAYEGYKKILDRYPNSIYKSRTMFKMLIICYSYEWYDKFMQLLAEYKNLNDIDPTNLNEISYLAGYILFQDKKYDKSITILQEVDKDSKQYMAAQYLLGIVYANLDDYAQARLIFERLVESENLPWTDINSAIIKNESALKLGYLYYQNGEYNKAVHYFDMVSKGYHKYDFSLVGQAWANLKKGEYEESIQKSSALTNNYLLSSYTYEAMVLSAHCNKIMNKKEDALQDLRYVSNSKKVLEHTKEYNEERKHILDQMEELERLEERILDRQDRKLYPQVVKIRDAINDALMSFYYRGSISSRVVEEYNDERNVLLRQIREFENIMEFAKEQQDQDTYKEALEQRNRLLFVLEKYPMENLATEVNHFVDYPLAVKEGGMLYQQDIMKKTISELLEEKRRVKSDLEMISQLLTVSSAETQMEVMMDLEILEEDLQDLHNQLNRFQVWLSNNNLEELDTETEYWADFSGFGISDINYTTYYEQIRKISSLSKNLSYVDEILRKKKDELEKRISEYDSHALKIEREMEAEKIRLDKLEKEKYFRDLYFETKVRETETDNNIEYNLDLNLQEP
ncbi:tetratricopeptide repeat protein [candidate division KSB1 bacterium]|nr:tetratricopeptide repeat protein [candidate division KSB1 bacterium]